MPEYGDVAYWNRRFERETTFEWLAPYSVFEQSLCSVLASPSSEKQVLHLGCGTSQLPIQLFQSGYTHIIHTDISPNLIEKQAQQYPCLQWQVVNALELDDVFPRQSMDVVFEKSVTDAILCDDDEDQSKFNRLQHQIFKVLKPGGVWWMMSYSKERHFHPSLWKINQIEHVIVDAGGAEHVDSKQSSVTYRPCISHCIYVVEALPFCL